MEGVYVACLISSRLCTLGWKGLCSALDSSLTWDPEMVGVKSRCRFASS